jgi:tRNA(Glu) U13 pseudouridine synthase TruD
VPVLARDWPEAIELLRRAETPESRRAQDFQGDPKQFFAELDERVTNLFKSAYASSRWNEALSRLVTRHCSNTYRYTVGDQSIALCASQPEILHVLHTRPVLSYEQHYDGGRIGLRPTVIQTQVQVSNITSDDANEGYAMCDLSFFLPSGAYATMCVTQLANMRKLIDGTHYDEAADACQ